MSTFEPQVEAVILSPEAAEAILLAAEQRKAKWAAYMRRYQQRPDVKAKRAAYRRRPDVKAKWAAYRRRYQQRPDVKAKRAAYMRVYSAKQKQLVASARASLDRG